MSSGLALRAQSKIGPCLRLRFEDDPRRNVPILRGADEFTKAYAKRTSTERFNYLLKGKGTVAAGAFRRQHILHVFSIGVAIELHARAWVRALTKPEAIKTFEDLMRTLAELGERLKPTPTQRAA
ncbi:MAG: hypothetical protein HY791_03940 [Deltaproteobacteria bacterium]|nr:hypothetical protein [Deltaproteobacteria bacterium]